MAHRLATLLGALAFLIAPPARAGDAPDPAKVEFFETKIRPLLADRCFACHGEKKQKGDLRLDTAEAMRTGGPSGPAVAPGDPESSLLIDAVRYEGFTKMPPDGRLHDDEIEALTDWVRQGAVWPGESVEVRPESATEEPSEDDRAFWAFQPVRDAPSPAVDDPDGWAANEVDRFILARLREAGLEPTGPADRRTLIRRVTFDLTGLPPTPEEVEAFVGDESPDAYADLVDRLLSSPAYGERWARHWLDVARYAEDQAHSFQPRLYPSGFRYRDWVVDAFNADMPYDRFVVEQIAADLIDRPDDERRANLPALGFFACGPVYYGDRKMFDQYDDRVDTLSRGLLGLTVACARCHDHKYDPISQRDYYGLAGVVASSEYVEAPLVPVEDVAAYQKGQLEIERREAAIKVYLDEQAGLILAERVADTPRLLAAARVLVARGQADAKGEAERLAADRGIDDRLLRRWAAYLADRGGKRPELAPLLRNLEDPEDARTDDEAAAAFAVRLAGLLPKRDLKSEAAKGLDDADRSLVEEIFGDKGVLGLPEKQVERELPELAKPRLAELKAERDRAKAEAPPMYPIAHALKDGKPRDLPVLVRGNADSPGDEAPRRFLGILGGDDLSLPDASGRLALARSIASPENPLTARVMVNRVWQHHFGRGLVGTSSNFGQLGERPSHPDLLDHLAARFMAGGWSLKALHREILLSSTYRQEVRSEDYPEAERVDPENRLLWRQNRRRLEVEAWRDALLAVSGRLEDARGGPSLNLDDPENRRRTLYARISRHDLNPLLRLFDFPDPNITSGERTRTTVPLQQLFVLNDELMIRAARDLAARVVSDVGDAPEPRIERAYALLFGRPPTDDERTLGMAYLGGPEPESGAGEMSRWERYAHVLLGTNEFSYLD